MNDKLREAAQQALEALRLNNDEWKALADSGDCGNWTAESQDHYQQANEAIAALEAALAQYQEQKDADYERGFLDGMQKQAESSVDRAVTRMALRAQERATPVKPAPPGLVGVTTVSSVSVTTQHRVLTDADLDAIRKIVREGGKE